MIKLYELIANESGVSPSPYVNMTELFLKHKVKSKETLDYLIFNIDIGLGI
jgi:hypothetical protein